MNRRKRILLALSGLVLLAIAGVWIVLWLTPPRHGITPEVVSRIKPGMTPAEVEAVMGMPPGFYRSDMDPGPGRQKQKPPIPRQINGKKIMAVEVMFWWVEDAAIEVYLDDNERVIDVDMHFQNMTARMTRPFRRIRLPGRW